MKLIPLKELFTILYGNSYDLTMLEESTAEDPLKINYVSRTRENNGVSAFVEKFGEVEPFEKGLITVAGSGNSVLESFIQPFPFYTGYHIFVLKEKQYMSVVEKLFYCFCIRKNRYKYSYGRQANKTLKQILVPMTVPANFLLEINKLSKITKEKVIEKEIILKTDRWQFFKISDLFTIQRGKEVINQCEPGEIQLISSTEKNNGVHGFIEGNNLFEGNVLTVAVNGSIAEAFYQKDNFYATTDIAVLHPKFIINEFIGLFIAVIIRREKYRFNFGRKWGYERMKNFLIKLPNDNGSPDFKFMENYVKSLPYSNNI